MKLYKLIYTTPLYIAVENENIEIIKLLLSNDKTDVNGITILFYIYKIQNFVIE